MSTPLRPPTLDRNDSQERVRLTISVLPQVHATFERMAAATNSSLSRTMGDWLADTHEAAEWMAAAVERAREAPKRAVREIQAALIGTADEAAGLLDSMRRGVHGGASTLRSGGPAPAGTPPFPPSSNTGGKSPGRTRGRRGSKA